MLSGERMEVLSRHLTVSKHDVTSCVPTIRAERPITLSTLINLVEGELEGLLVVVRRRLMTLWERGMMLGRCFVLRFGDQFECVGE